MLTWDFINMFISGAEEHFYFLQNFFSPQHYKLENIEGVYCFLGFCRSNASVPGKIWSTPWLPGWAQACKAPRYLGSPVYVASMFGCNFMFFSRRFSNKLRPNQNEAWPFRSVSNEGGKVEYHYHQCSEMQV